MGTKSNQNIPLAAVYARISLDRKEQAGVTRQVHLATQLAAAHGFTVSKKFIDNSISAYSGSTRPQYEELLSEIKSGNISRVYVYAVDRLTRRLRDILDILDICERHGVSIHAVTGSGIDPADPGSRLTASILGMVAEQESADKSARVAAAMRRRAELGQPKRGGSRMFGYESDAVTIREDEAQAIRDAAAAILAGKSLRSIASDLSSRGLTSTRGNTLTAAAIRDILTTPRIAGISTFIPTDKATGYRLRKDRVELGPGSWPAILDAETFAQVGAVLSSPSRKISRAGQPPSTFLSSVMYCTCGTTLYYNSRVKKDGTRRHYFACKRLIPGGKHVSIGDEVIPLIEQLICARMMLPDARDALTSALVPNKNAPLRGVFGGLLSHRQELMDRRGAFEHQAAAGELPASAFTRVIIDISSQIEQVDKEISALSTESENSNLINDIDNAYDFNAWWRSASVEDQRAVCKALMEIHIKPGKPGAKHFDPGRVQVTWRT